ncbi:hypothetical protein [Pseudanabaena sp. FACHB-2040]|uniref:hypothetical protein n=1 Tax=Pseudanabaena sp. FACHB-2040 TaxID=2692859 RepID=UPI001683100B|nr:hypothetical protein [Pseudanabaena sp. FACHB-2040]MBD2256649.1 hypothetical protein [Pseudanabaena sp. FACHB-2040]
MTIRMRNLSVKVCAIVDAHEMANRRIIQTFTGTISSGVFEEDFIQLGEISGVRFSGQIDEVVNWADIRGDDIYIAAEWLANHPDPDEIEMALNYGCLYIENVFIEPEWRGKFNVLKAVATYIDVVVNDGFVFLMPCPWKFEGTDEEKARQCVRLRHLWKKLGMKNYDEEANILWSYVWQSPEWLAGE